MGKRPKFAQADARRRAQADDGASTAFNLFEGSGYEPGLCVVKRQGGVVYLAIFGLSVMLALGTLLALTATLPRLLTHWTWLLFTLFSAAIFVGRWVYPEVEAWLIFFLILTVHGLLWITLLLVPLRGVTPATLWHAFGVHGGDHLLLAQMGDVPLLGFPPLALAAFMAWEEKYLVAIFHDFLTQMAPGNYNLVWNLMWQICSPILPLGLWAACLRPPLFTDLPAWPGVLDVLLVCLLANGPVLLYAYHRSAPLHGAAHWFEGGGVVLWSTGRFV